MIRTRRRNRAAIVSSDDEESLPWRKRLRSSNNQQTLGNQQIQLKINKQNKNRKTGRSKVNLKNKNSGFLIYSDLTSSDEENGLNQAAHSDYVSGNSSDDENINIASSSSGSLSNRNVINSSIGSFIVTSSSKNQVLSGTNEEDLPAGSEDETPSNKVSALKASSDYETGDSSERGQTSLDFVSQNQSDPCDEDQDSFSDNNIKRPNHRQNRFSFLSTSSDSDLSDTVIKPLQLRKRIRIASSSEESDSDTGIPRRSFTRNRPRTNPRLESLERNRTNPRNPEQQAFRHFRIARISNVTENQFGQTNNYQRRVRRGRSREASQSNRELRFRYNSSYSRERMSYASSSDFNSESSYISPIRSFTTRMEHVNPTMHRGFGTRNRINPGDVTSSSESDIGLGNSNTRRRGALVTIQESDEDTCLSTIRCSPVPQVGSDSDGESEKCPICFTRFDIQEIGSPISCEHFFCALCIQEWANNKNTCPIDRKIFDKIIVRSQMGGQVIREVEVQPPMRNFWDESLFDEAGFMFAVQDNLVLFYEDEDEPEPTEPYFFDLDDEGPEEICCVCYNGNQLDNLVVCDFCDAVYHMTCLNPPLRSIPADVWYCPNCSLEEFIESDPNLDSSSSSD